MLALSTFTRPEMGESAQDHFQLMLMMLAMRVAEIRPMFGSNCPALLHSRGRKRMLMMLAMRVAESAQSGPAMRSNDRTGNSLTPFPADDGVELPAPLHIRTAGDARVSAKKFSLMLVMLSVQRLGRTASTAPLSHGRRWGSRLKTISLILMVVMLALQFAGSVR